MKEAPRTVAVQSPNPSDLLLEKYTQRDFQPLFTRRWKELVLEQDDPSICTTAYKGISNSLAYIEVQGGGEVLNNYYMERSSKLIKHREGGPSNMGLWDNEVMFVNYYLFDKSLSAADYWIRLIVMCPNYYLTKAIGSKIFIKSVSNKIPAPHSIDLKKGERGIVEHRLNNRRISEERFWQSWEHHFTVLGEKN